MAFVHIPSGLFSSSRPIPSGDHAVQGSTGFRSRRLSRRLAATPQHIARSESKIYVAAVPLVGTERLQDLAKSLGQTLPPLLALHRVVLVQQPDEQHCRVFDFLPLHPTSPATAVTLLSGGSVEGSLRERQLSQVPSRNCDLVGFAPAAQVLEKSRAFQAAWNRRLHLIGNDCRTHAAALAEHLVQGTYTKTKLL